MILPILLIALIKPANLHTHHAAAIVTMRSRRPSRTSGELRPHGRPTTEPLSNPVSTDAGPFATRTISARQYLGMHALAQVGGLDGRRKRSPARLLAVLALHIFTASGCTAALNSASVGFDADRQKVATDDQKTLAPRVMAPEPLSFAALGMQPRAQPDQSSSSARDALAPHRNFEQVTADQTWPDDSKSAYPFSPRYSLLVVSRTSASIASSSASANSRGRSRAMNTRRLWRSSDGQRLRKAGGWNTCCTP